VFPTADLAVLSGFPARRVTLLALGKAHL